MSLGMEKAPGFICTLGCEHAPEYCNAMFRCERAGFVTATTLGYIGSPVGAVTSDVIVTANSLGNTLVSRESTNVVELFHEQTLDDSCTSENVIYNIVRWVKSPELMKFEHGPLSLSPFVTAEKVINTLS